VGLNQDHGGRINFVGLCQGGGSMSAKYAARFPRSVVSLLFARVVDRH
jgi:poly(3-hydroxyalkanoate) synthetase